MLQPLVLPILHATQNPPMREAPIPEHSKTALQKMQTLPLTRRASDPNICTSIRRSQLTYNTPANTRKQPPNAKIDRAPSKMPIPRPQTPALEIDAPPPEIFVDTESGRYGIRCICSQQVNEGLMVQCSKCGFWVHAMCVNLARALPTDTYLCPFCKRRPLRCKCGDAKKYDEPIIQCPKCKYWAHKHCMLLGYGRNPPEYACSNCGGYQISLPPLSMNKDSGVNNVTTFITSNRTSLVQQIPEGPFRNSIISDLNKGEINLYEMMNRYFVQFVEPIFNEDPDFWHCFVETMMSLLGCTEKAIFDSLDFLANQLIYKPMPEHPPLFVALNKFSMSDRASMVFDDSQILPKYDRPLNEPKLVKKGNAIYTESNIEDNQLIREVPGFLCFYMEMPASQGLLKQWISIPNSDFVIDTDIDKTSLTLCPSIRRSFHYNCQPRVVRLNGAIKVVLIAHRLRGPIHDKAAKKGFAIPAGCELLLPLDSDLPYSVPHAEWRSRKARTTTTTSIRHPHLTRSMDKNKNDASKMTPKNDDNRRNKGLGLLSLFYDYSAPPLPMQVLTKEEVEEMEKEEAILKASARIMTRRSLRSNDDNAD